MPGGPHRKAPLESTLGGGAGDIVSSGGLWRVEIRGRFQGRFPAAARLRWYPFRTAAAMSAYVASQWLNTCA